MASAYSILKSAMVELPTPNLESTVAIGVHA